MPLNSSVGACGNRELNAVSGGGSAKAVRSGPGHMTRRLRARRARDRPLRTLRRFAEHAGIAVA
jgi:hypothetical protein